MATNYTQREAALSEIAQVISSEINRMNQSVAAFTTAKNTLNGLTSKYSSIITEINDDATNNPSDEMLQIQKKKKDKFVSDFQNARTRATNLETASSGI